MNQLKSIFTKFMQGRYGADILARDMLYLALGLMIINLIVRSTILSTIALVILVIGYLRMFSKNHSARYNENRRYTNIRYTITDKISKRFRRVKDSKKYKYLKCPQCSQQLRVPRGKKQIVVTCPKCKSKFDAKS